MTRLLAYFMEKRAALSEQRKRYLLDIFTSILGPKKKEEAPASAPPPPPSTTSTSVSASEKV